MIVRVIAAIAALNLVTGCLSVDTQHDAPVNHIVLCWLKDAGNAEQRGELIRVSHTFRHIPGVVNVVTGPVLSSARDIVDDSFDTAIVITFRTVADMNAYLVHPKHKQAVHDVLRPLISKIVVYDFVAEPGGAS